MNLSQALSIEQAFAAKASPTPEERSSFIEAMDYLVRETGESHYMLHLGGYYYENGQFEQAVKYYEAAADMGDVDALMTLGYIWFNGRTGQQDYCRAYKYFGRAAALGDLTAKYKLADMYKNGYYVAADYDRYCQLIEEIYPQLSHACYASDPLPEVYTRLAKIRVGQGMVEEALSLYFEARDFLARRLEQNGGAGNLTMMKNIIGEIYGLISFEASDFGFYDFYRLLLKPAKVYFRYRKQIQEVESIMADEKCVIRFNTQWYENIDEFFERANIDGQPLTALYSQLHSFDLVFG